MLISQTEVITESLTYRNIDPALLKEEYIDRAERMYIRPSVGTDLYNDLLSNPATTTNAALLILIKKALAWFVVYESLPMIYTQVTAQGVMFNAPEFARGGTRNDMAAIRDFAFSTAEFERKEYICYIHEHRSDYPLYDPQTDIRTRKGKILMYGTRTPDGLRGIQTYHEPKFGGGCEDC